MTDVELRLTADLDQATKEVAGFRKEYQDMVRAVEKPLRQVNIARDLERDLDATGKAVRSTKEQLRALQSELINTDRPSERLKTQYRDMTSELQRLERVEARQQTQLSRMRGELTGAGIDTSRLAQEQRRLNAELTAGLAAGRNDAAVSGIRARAAALAQVTREQRIANVEAARSDLGVNRFRQLQTEITRARNQYQLLRVSGKVTAQELSVAQQQLTQKIRESNQAMKELAGQRAGGGLVAEVGGRLGLGGGIVAGVAGGAALAAQYAAAVDPIKKMEAQLKLATASQEEFARAQAETFRIAQDNQAPLTDVVTLYSRLAPALNDVGRGQGDALKIIDAVTKSLRISGATAAETASTIQQFSQALGSGVLRGEEFNTLAESSPRLLRALADGLNVNVGALRAMAAEGQLTADVISDALIGQLSKLSEEAATLPDTFGGAVTKLGNALQAALGKFDQATGASARLVDQVNRLTDSVNLLASGSGDNAAAGVTKLVTEIGRLVPVVDLAYSATERLQGLLGMKTNTEQLQEMVKEEAQVYDFRAERLAAHAAKVRGIQKQAADDGKRLHDQQVIDTEAALKRQVNAERKAASDLEKAKKAQLETQQRYQEALASLNVGSGGSASYSQAQSLKVAADAALRSGDVEGAKRQAQAALQVLQELAKAGENTYGFQGFIKQLQAIESAADKQNFDAAAKGLEQAKQSVEQTKAALKELKDVKVAPTLDEVAQQQLLSQLAALAKKAGILLTIPATVVAPQVPGSTGANAPDVPGFAGGGYTGPGGRYEPAGVVHRGEVVWSQVDVARAGGVAVVEAMRRGMRGYDMGGIVGPRSIPSIPALAPELQQQLDGPVFPDLGRVVLEAGGREYSLYAPPQEVMNFRRNAMKFGKS